LFFDLRFYRRIKLEAIGVNINMLTD